MSGAWTDEAGAARLREELVAELVAGGAIRSESWRRAFLAVPRHRFLETVYRRSRVRGQVCYELDRPSLEQAYRDDSLVVRVDSSGRRATSSSTTPSLMASMLEALDVDHGHRVLEIGTGTGYNAALLCERLGSETVTSIDLHPELVEAAGRCLADLGYRPRLAVADGRLGYPPAAPYDRIIATCSVRRIPTSWLAQTRPGGIIVANLQGDHTSATVRLVVGGNGSAEGRFLPDDAAFIEIEGEEERTRLSMQELADRWIRGEAPTRPAHVPEAMEDGRFWFLTQRLLPHVVLFSTEGRPWCLVDYRDLSWARVEESEAGPVVAQGGPQRLWDRLEEADALWTGSGRPGFERYGLTIEGEGRQRLWLDAPESHGWDL
ncbi:MAG TPA: methyltransferase domain-containing protein [Candidatus Dormibacteraeota bacterium]|nr:methyltransferase domain-containing protein [Candidatus Dormibacteraeota bacterium]